MINLLIQITPITVIYPQVERQLINFWGKVNETLKIVEPHFWLREYDLAETGETFSGLNLGLDVLKPFFDNIGQGYRIISDNGTL
jgi:hypothetical protein